MRSIWHRSYGEGGLNSCLDGLGQLFWEEILNPCQDGLDHFFRNEVPQSAQLSAGGAGWCKSYLGNAQINLSHISIGSSLSQYGWTTFEWTILEHLLCAHKRGRNIAVRQVSIWKFCPQLDSPPTSGTNVSTVSRDNAAKSNSTLVCPLLPPLVLCSISLLCLIPSIGFSPDDLEHWVHVLMQLT